MYDKRKLELDILNHKRGEEIDKNSVEEKEVLDQWGAEFYDLLCSLTSGEALTIVRAETSMNGFLAWNGLYKRFNPIEPAKALAVMMEVMNPPKVSDPNRVPKAIDDWDVKVAMLQREFGEKLSDRMKTALMLSMCPPVLQDILYQHAGDSEQKYLMAQYMNACARNTASPCSKHSSMVFALSSTAFGMTSPSSPLSTYGPVMAAALKRACTA